MKYVIYYSIYLIVIFLISPMAIQIMGVGMWYSLCFAMGLFFGSLRLEKG